MWVFDLDNTLYPADTGLFAEVDRRIEAFMALRLGIPEDRIAALRAGYKARYGSTLGGLMAHHGVEPREFLAFVHDVPLDGFLGPDPDLGRALDRLEGPKVVFTNGSAEHARAILERLGVGDRFLEVFDIAFADYTPKPRPHGYRKLLRALGRPGPGCWLVDDLVENLDTGHSLGMNTVRVGPDPAPPHLHVASVKDLPERLSRG